MSRWSLRGLALAALGWSCWLSVTACEAQNTKQPPPQPVAATTIAVDAKLVTLPVVVHDKKGCPGAEPDQGRFALQVDGHAQAIQIDLGLPRSKDLYVQTRDGYYTEK